MQTGDKTMGRIKHWKVVALYLIGYDVIAVNLAYFAALWFRFDCRYSEIPQIYLHSFFRFTVVYSIVCIIVFWIFRLYSSIWRFASYYELSRVTLASFSTSAFHVLGMVACLHAFPQLGIVRMPISYFAIGTILQFCLIAAVRFSYRFILMLRSISKNVESSGERVMLVGAGSAGQMVLHSMSHADGPKDKVCCIIDDNPNKWNRYIDGVPVVGGKDDILNAVEAYKIDKIYVAIPSATVEQKRDILNICKESGCELKNLPDVYRFASDGVSVVEAMAEVTMEDLLGRKPVQVDMVDIFHFIQGKTILVTGGGGSIGSELCRQVAGHKPKQLIIFDIYENNAYEIENELRRKYPQLDLVVLIGSVRDSARINKVFETYRPDVVYHAAAHKHVPLMETSPCEAIKNNVFGTYKTAYAAMMNGCQRFVLISSDKAVNPTNIMGASKRMCEMVIQSFDRMIKEHRESEIPCLHAHMNEGVPNKGTALPKYFQSETEFVAVRFGNVLGSNGSVVPLFKKQIELGGPVTVTHPDIIRYFMTIQEAVSLVMQAGTFAESGTIYVLEMGEPVKIDTLARNLIKLSGLKPDVDIKIEYTGLRPGEKLYEEKLMDEEGLRTTQNKLIHIGSPIPMDIERFFYQLEELMGASYDERGDFKRMVADIVPTYHIPAENREKAGDKDAICIS